MTSTRSSRDAHLTRGESGLTAAEPAQPTFKSGMPYQTQFLARLLQNDYLSRIADTGIAPAQVYVLAELWFNEPLSQVELARRLDIGKATVGQTLNRLERAGLIERRRLEADRRVIMIYLTEAGRRMRSPLERATLEQAMMIEHRLGRAEVEQLTALLIRATGILAEDAAADVSAR